jgi:hypothetical protein
VVGADVGPGGGDRAAAERDEEAATGLEGSSGGHGGGGWFRGGAAISDGGFTGFAASGRGKKRWDQASVARAPLMLERKGKAVFKSGVFWEKNQVVRP